jgi:hypothetical protein
MAYLLNRKTFRDSGGNLRRPWGYADGKDWAEISFPTDGLISYWALDGTSGDVVDSHDGHPGTNYGATRGVAGKINNCFSFDGVDDYVNFGDQSAFSMNIQSIMCWFNASGISSNHTVISKGNASSAGFNIFIQSDGTIRVQCCDGSVMTSTNTVSTGSWHQVIFTDNSGEGSLYLDNQLEDTVSGGVDHNSHALWIGDVSNDAGSWVFDGLIDEVAMWNKILTSDERDDLYNNGSGLEYS